MRIGWLVSLTALGAVGTIGVAIAQAPGEAAGEVIYEQSYFAPFAPRTALDMVLRVPGFSLNEGEERRGFARAQSNVLIDGAPPTSKAQEIDDILARIPASDVERIELIRGSDSIAASAQSARVNIVRRTGDGGGVWELSAEQAVDGRVSPGGEAAWSGRAGAVRYGGSADLDIAHLPIRGVRVDHDEAGAVEQRRVERVPTEEREVRLAGEAAFPFHGGEFALNAQLSRAEAEEREAATLLDAAGAPAGAIAGALDEAEDIAELGASLSRRIGDWQTQSAAVITRRRFTADEGTSEYDAAGALREAADQRQRLTAGETIVRVTGERPLTRRWRVKASVEAAFNTLEQRLMLTVDEGAGPTPVDLPSANVRVEEERAEASAMLAATFPPGWSVEAGLAVEVSRLIQSGDADQQAELAYWKPSIQVLRALGERNQVRLRLYRDVGQLDFEDFVSVADITSSLVDAGNPDLRPETSWRIELGGDWRFAEEGAINLTLYRWAIEDALDIVPLGPPDDRLDAPGNIGAATAYGARVSLALPLPWDAELRLDGFAQRSEATDPLTGEERSLSEFEESALTIGFRQDIAPFAWGLDYERETEAAAFGFDRIERERDAEELTLWFETTALADVKLRAWGSNLSDDTEERRRQLFDPDRLGGFDGSDRRARGEGLSFGVSVGGRF